MNRPVKDYFISTSVPLYCDGAEALMCHLWEQDWLEEGEEDPGAAAQVLKEPHHSSLPLFELLPVLLYCDP